MHSSGKYDRFDNNQDEEPRRKSQSRSKSRQRPSTMDQRPPWNNDTYIEGYDDVDEHGKYKNRSGPLPKSKNSTNQEDLTKSWTESLRDKHHQADRK